MWSSLLEPRLHLVSASRSELRGFSQELTQFTVQQEPDKQVLWCEGQQGFFDPYGFAELNLERGLEPELGARRILVKRCMTAFNWELALDKHVPQKLEEADVAAVVMAPYDTLFRHQELADWEQEDYVRFSLKHLKALARQHQVPLLAMVDMDRLWRSHPVLAQLMFERMDRQWTVDRPDGRWRAVEHRTGQIIDPYLRRQVTLLDFIVEPEEVVVSPRPRKHPQILRH